MYLKRQKEVKDVLICDHFGKEGLYWLVLVHKSNIYLKTWIK